MLEPSSKRLRGAMPSQRSWHTKKSAAASGLSIFRPVSRTQAQSAPDHVVSICSRVVAS
ncbi:hypothetical protein PAXRUDRAFT_825275 [Paxillus rubicundulus Ve08.2h10]|uniref:Uncharacterized protein n=1 Tax=Paxillus rubicundulus Ve08.2h10 TaxID=930991 RepID=A0A0D0E6H7_9AGAM|nr:hypothetical protein PAXRUDRAFT_825275 [Paxillus rubicundulus Ve08.2h10]